MSTVFEKIRELAGKIEKGSTTQLDDRARACRAAKGEVEQTKALLANVRTELREGWSGGAGEKAIASLDAFAKNRDEQAEDLENSARSFEVVRDALEKAQKDARSKLADAEALQKKLDGAWRKVEDGKSNTVLAWAEDKVIKGEALLVLADLERVSITYDAVLLAEGLKIRNLTGRVWELAGSNKREPAEIIALALREMPGLAALVAKDPNLRMAVLRRDWDTLMKNPEVAQKVYDYFGFKYVENGDFYTTGEHSLQSFLGWHDFYDKMGGLIGTHLDETSAGGDNMEFTDPKTGKQYRLELWKGSYGFHGAYGGEVGFYSRDPNSDGLRGKLEHDHPGYYSTAQGEDQIKITQQVYDKNSGEVYFTNDGQGADGDDKRHFWNLAIRTDPDVRPEQLGQRATLEMPDADLRDRLYREMTRYATAHPEERLTVTMGTDHPPTLSYDWRK